MRRGRLALIAAGVLITGVIALAGGCGSRPAASTPTVRVGRPCGSRSKPPARYGHVVWIVMENKPYRAILGSSAAPYENQLAARCGSAAKFFAETHPSLPNYIAMTSGSTHGISDDNGPASHRLNGPSIFSQLPGTWRALQESMPHNCARSPAGTYAVKHNPAAYFTNLAAACATRDKPLTATLDISAKFTFVTPNLCNDTHDCSVATGDRWLQKFLGRVFASAQYKAGSTAVFVTWDEDDSSGSNQIATIVAARSVTPGAAPNARFDHYSLLRTTEELLGLRPLGNAAHARSMRSAFGL